MCVKKLRGITPIEFCEQHMHIAMHDSDNVGSHSTSSDICQLL